jgi:selenide,water dikinase
MLVRDVQTGRWCFYEVRLFATVRGIETRVGSFHMQTVHPPVLKDIVLIGAGHSHVGVLRMFGMDPMPGVRLTLVTRQVHTPYSGMLPGLIAGLYDHDEAHIDTGPLSRFAQARLYHSEVIGLDLAAKCVICRDRPPVPYDVLSINIGSTPSARQIPGAAEHAIPVKPIDGFIARFETAHTRVLKARGRARIGVVGGGAGGVELLLSLHRRLTRDVAVAGFDAANLTFTLITESDEILPSFPPRMRRRFTEILCERGIHVVTGGRVSQVQSGAVVVDGHGVIALDEVFWTTRAAPAAWLGDTGLALDAEGFIRVTEALQSVSHPDVFAAGDIAAIEGHALPKSGVYAVRSGPPLARNMRRILESKSLVSYKPQREALYLISTGERYALGARNGFTFEGAWVWKLKDFIDRRFMARFRDLPDMVAPAATPVPAIADREAIKEISAMAMRCGGCGAKVGATVLTRALGTVEPAARNDVVVGLDAPDDAAVVDAGGPHLSVHTVDYFRAVFDDPYTFGRIAANHALGDIYAMGAEPQTALAIATVPYGIEAKVEADLSQMMAGANDILREAGCALVGGHTSEGAELSLGFAVNGLVDRDAALRKGGLRPGDALILTKQIGTGSLLAAHMRGKAKARWVMQAIASMTQSNHAAAHILRAHAVTAATDITGFGLLGHLVEMVKAGDVDATLWLLHVPLLEGLQETMAAGIFSSLQPQNVRMRLAIGNLDAAAAHPLYPVLFDPQTAGGLLASVPFEHAHACVAALRAAGYASAAVVGLVEPRSASLAAITVAIDDRHALEPLRSIPLPSQEQPGLRSSAHQSAF